MAKINEVFESKYLSAADLNGRDVVVTISEVRIEMIGRGNDAERKPVVFFEGKKKALVCNKTNAKTIGKIVGSDETDDWVGHQIVLSPREVEYQGDMVWAIRVSLQPPSLKTGAAAHAPGAPTKAVRPAPKPVAPTPAPEAQDEAVDEDVPF